MQTDSIRTTLFTWAYKKTNCLLYCLLLSLVYIQTTKKQLLCLDNDGSNIVTLDNISCNLLIIIITNIELAKDTGHLLSLVPGCFGPQDN